MAAAKPHRIVMLGPPGSGKGTQAALMAETLGIPAISTGEMLRAAVAAESDLGRKVQAIMADGGLVDDETMADVVRERLAQADAAGGFILDGYPRTGPQVDTLADILSAGGLSVDAVVFVDAPESVLVERALARKRADDTAETIANRLRVYAEDTAPLVERYTAQGILHAIDGNRSVDEVNEAILAALGEAS